jgi:hypothetical protein
MENNCTGEVPISNLCRITDYPVWGFNEFPQSLQENAVIVSTTASFHIRSNSLFTIIRPFDVTQTGLLAASCDVLEEEVTSIVMVEM